MRKGIRFEPVASNGKPRERSTRSQPREMEDRPEGRQAQRDGYTVISETLISEPPLDQSSTSPQTASGLAEDDHAEPLPALNQTEIFRALEVVERDSVAIAESFTSLFASLRLALSEVKTQPFYSEFFLPFNFCLAAEKMWKIHEAVLVSK